MPEARRQIFLATKDGVARPSDMIKRIGTAARLELERFFETKVYLDLHVKVKPGWREDERILDTLGLDKAKPRPRGERGAGRPRARRGR